MRPSYWAGLAIAALAFYKRTTLQGLAMTTNSALSNANVQAFLAMIRHFESGGDYAILYGGGHFSDFSTHPDVKVPFYDQQLGREDYSTAAGAYQINYPTWLIWRAVALTGNDFSPPSQDKLAIAGLKLHGVLPDIMEGNFAAAVAGISNVWASMPGSAAQQNPASLAAVRTVYTDNGGLIA